MDQNQRHFMYTQMVDWSDESEISEVSVREKGSDRKKVLDWSEG